MLMQIKTMIKRHINSEKTFWKWPMLFMESTKKATFPRKVYTPMTMIIASISPCLHHYYILGLFCDPNIIVNNKERCFWNLAVANHNSLQILKLLRYHNIRTRTIASPLQLPNLIQSQNFSDYNCFYPLFVINTTSETICNKPITAST
jgi:hypothetical protein